MITSSSIKEKSMEVLYGFMCSLKEYHNIEIPTKYHFFTQVIDDSAHTKQYIENKTEQRKTLVKAKPSDIDELVHIIYENQDKISWVDFYLYYIDIDTATYIVELVCLNKTSDEINYHVCTGIF